MNKPMTSWTKTLAALRLKVNWEVVFAKKLRKQAILKKTDSSLQVHVLEPRQMLSADIGSLALLSDTGESATDSFTTNGMISGQATGIASGSTVTIEVDADGDQTSDYSVAPIGDYSSGTANFEFDVNQYQDLWEPGQKDLNFRVASTDAANVTTYSAWNSFSFHLSEFDAATLEQSSDPDLYQLGDNKLGVGIDDTATGVGFIMYSEESVHTRFTVHTSNSDHLVGVRYNSVSSGWEYSTNVDGEWLAFTLAEKDRLIAAVDFDNDTIESLQGQLGEVNGIASGFSQGDLTFAANVWNGVANDGEFTITGTQFEVDTLTVQGSVRTEIGATNFGIAVDDLATGNGYIMYSEQDVHSRFSLNPPSADQSDHLIAIRYNDLEEFWEYNADGTDWFEFQVAEGDRLLASVDYSHDSITSLEGYVGDVFGIKQGFTIGDLEFEINQWNSAADDGEFVISGTYFSVSDHGVQQPKTFDLGLVDLGIAVDDAATGLGYVMYSSENVHERFIANPPAVGNSENLIAVRYNATSEKWEYNADGATWFEFAVSGNDRLIATLDFSNDTIESLRGAAGDIHGIDQGFTRGDLTFEANSWNSASDVGEFTISGTEFTVNPIDKGDAPTLRFPNATNGMQQSQDYYLGDLKYGLPVGDSETGTGYVMYSVEDVHDRFADGTPPRPLMPMNSEHLVVVHYNDTTSKWEYNRNGSTWYQFSLAEGDRLLASLDFANDTIVSLKGATGEIHGVTQGFSSDNLIFEANVYNGTYGEGEFSVGGSRFTVTPIEWPTRTIQFQNTGTHSADLQSVNVPFGFEVIDFSATTLAPGETIDIEIGITGLIGGAMSGQMAIQVVSQGAEQIHTVNLEGYVYEPEVEVSFQGGDAAEREFDYGVLTVGQTVSKKITVTNIGRAAINLSDDIVVPDGFVISAALSSTVLLPGNSAEVIVDFTATEQGMTSGVFRINLAERMIPVFSGALLAEVDVPRLAISVDGSDFEHTGGTADFGAVMVGTAVERTIVVKNEGVTSLDITDITLPTGVQIIGYTGPFSILAGASASFVLRLDSSVNISVADEVVIHSNDPNESEFAIATIGAVVNIQSPKLLNDAGTLAEATDNISNDPRIAVDMADVPLYIAEGDVIAHVDIDGDGTADESYTVVSNRFVYDPQLETEGQFTRTFQFEVINSVTGVSEFTNWMAITAEYDTTVTNSVPTLGTLQLAGDGLTGTQMMSTVINGSVANDGSLVDLVVLVDHDDDGIADGVAAVLPDGTFEYNGYGLELGLHTLTFSVIELTYSGEVLTSATQTIDFELIAYPAPSFNSIELANPSSADPLFTSIPTIKGVISEGDAEGRYYVLWDTVADGDFQNGSQVDEFGNFEFDVLGLGVGQHTIYLQSVDTETGAISSSSSFVFDLESKAAPTLDTFALKNDTTGFNVTADPTVVGTISSEWGVTDREIQFDYDGDGEADGSGYADENGAFEFLPEALTFGATQIGIRTVIFDTVTGADVFSAWQSLDFTFERTIDSLVTGFGLRNDDGSGTTTEPIVEGVVEASPGTPAPFTEVEFDYNLDGTADGSTLSNGLGEFAHFADVTLGSAVTLRVRARQIDDYNGEYIYGNWASVTFNREAGAPDYGDENAESLAGSSAQHSDSLAAAVESLLVDVKDQFNNVGGGVGGPGGGPGSSIEGFDLGHVGLSIGTNNEAFGVTGDGNNSIDSGQESSSSYLVMTTGLAAKASASGVVSSSLNAGGFAVSGNLNYTITNTGTTFSFVYTLAYTLTAADGDVVTGSIGGTFSNTNGTFDFTETFTVLGTVDDSSSENKTDYQSTLTTQNGVLTTAQSTYDFTRTELINNTAGLGINVTGATGDADSGQIGTYTETGSAAYNLTGSSTQSKSVTRNYTSSYDYLGSVSRGVDLDGVSGSITGPESDDYDNIRMETGDYDLVDGDWVFTGGTFSDSIISSSTLTETSSGTYTSAGSGGTGEIYVGSSEGNTGTDQGVVASYTYFSTRILTEGSTYNVSGSIAADGTITANFTLLADSSYDVDMALTGTLAGSVNGITTTGSGLMTYIELSTTDYDHTGSYTDSLTSFTINSSGTNIYDTDSTLNRSGSKTVSGATFSKTTNLIQFNVHHLGGSTNNFNYNSDASGVTNSGSYTINDTTTTIGSTSGSATYTNHETRASMGSAKTPATVTGSSSGNSSFDTSLVLIEGGTYAIDSAGSVVVGTFDKSGSENRSGGSIGDLTYSSTRTETNYTATSQQTVQKALNNLSTSSSTDIGGFTLYFDSTAQMSSTADYDGGYGQGSQGEPSVITGDYTNNGTTSGDSIVNVGFSSSNVFTGGASSTSSGHINTFTIYSAGAGESGNYSITDGVRSGGGIYIDTKDSTSITDSASTTTNKQGAGGELVGVDGTAGGDVTTYGTNNVTTTTIFTENGNHTDSAGQTTAIGNYTSTVDSTGSGTAGSSTTGDGTGFSVDTTTSFTRNTTDNGTSTTVAETDKFANSSGGGSGGAGGGYTVMTAEEIGGDTSRTGTFTSDYKGTTNSETYAYADASEYGHTYHYRAWTISHATESAKETNGQYSYAADGSGSRSADFDNSTKSQTLSVSTEDTSYSTPGGETPYVVAVVLGVPVPTLNRAEGTSISTESHELTTSTTTINRSEDGTSTETTDALGGTTSTRSGNLNQMSDTVNYTHKASSGWSRVSTKNSFKFESGSSTVDSLSKSHQFDLGTITQTGDDITETVTRELNKKSVSLGKAKSYTNTSGPNGDYSNMTTTTTTSGTSTYDEDGTVTETENETGIRQNVQADGNFKETSSTFKKIVADGKEHSSGKKPNVIASTGLDGSGAGGMGASGPGDANSESTDYSSTNSFAKGTFSNTGSGHHRSGTYSSKDVSGREGKSTYDGKSVNEDGSVWTNSSNEKSKSTNTSSKTNGVFVDSTAPGLSRNSYDFKLTDTSSGSGSGSGVLSSTDGSKSGNSTSSFGSGSSSTDSGSVDDDGEVRHRTSKYEGSDTGFQNGSSFIKTTSVDFWSIAWDVGVGVFSGTPSLVHKEWGKSNNSSETEFDGSSETWDHSRLGESFTVELVNSDPTFSPNYKSSSNSHKVTKKIEHSKTYIDGSSENTTTATQGDTTTTITKKAAIEIGEENNFNSTDERTLKYAAVGSGDGGSPLDTDYTEYSLSGKLASNDKSDDYNEQSWSTETSVSNPNSSSFENEYFWTRNSDTDTIAFVNTYEADSPDTSDLLQGTTEVVSYGNTTSYDEWGNRSGEGDTVTDWNYYNDHFRNDNKTTVTTPTTSDITYTKTHTWVSGYWWIQADGDNDADETNGSDSNVSIVKTTFADDIEWWNEYGDSIQLGLDALGMIPVYGFLFDLANAGISVLRGNYLESALNLAAAIPGVGQAVTAAKWAKKAATVASKSAKYIGKSSKTVSGVTQMGSKALGMAGNGAKRAASYTGKAVDGIRDVGKRVKCKFTGKGCFVGDTEVLVYEHAPTEIVANWAPIELPTENTTKGNQAISGAWIAFSATGVVIVLAKKLKERKRYLKKSGLEFLRPNEFPLNHLTFVLGDELRSLRACYQKIVDSTLASTCQPRLAFSGVMGDNFVKQSTNKTSRVSSAFGMRFRKDDKWNKQANSGQSLSDNVARDCTKSNSDRVPPKPATGTDNVLVRPMNDSATRTIYKDNSWLSSTSIAMKLMLLSLVTSLAFGAQTFFADNSNSHSMPLATELCLNGASLTPDSTKPSLISSKLTQAGIESPDLIAAIPIRDVHVGMRVPAVNPELDDEQSAAPETEVVSTTWRKFTLSVEKADGGGGVCITLLRPSTWLVDKSAATTIGIQAALNEEYLKQRKTRATLQIGLENDNLVNPLGELTKCGISLARPWDNSLLHCDLMQGSMAYCLSFIEMAIVKKLAAVEAYLAQVDEVQAGGGVNSKIWLDMPELGAVGLATVVENEPCPIISNGPGEVVTATFAHQSSDVLDLTFTQTSIASGQPRYASLNSTERVPTSELTIGTTFVHPFWSVDRRTFVAAGELELDEKVVTIDGLPWRLTSIVPRAGPEPVYNIEVANEHVYYVGREGLLVHNTCANESVYLIHSADGKVKYVGITNSPVARKAAHRLSGNLRKGETFTVIAKNLSHDQVRNLESALIRKIITAGTDPKAAKVADQLAGTLLRNKNRGRIWDRVTKSGGVDFNLLLKDKVGDLLKGFDIPGL